MNSIVDLKMRIYASKCKYLIAVRLLSFFAYFDHFIKSTPIYSQWRPHDRHLWRTRRDSNPQPTDSKSGALSVELRVRIQIIPQNPSRPLTFLSLNRLTFPPFML